MRNGQTIWRSLLYAAMLALPLYASGQNADPISLSERIAALQEEIRQTRDMLTLLESAVDHNREQGRTLGADIDAVETAIERRQIELRRTQSRYEDRRAAKAEQRHALATQIRAHYLSGRAPHIKLLLSQEDPTVLGRALAYTNYLHRTRVAAINRAASELADLAQLAAGVERELAELDRLQKRYLGALAKLEEERNTARAGIRQARSQLQQREAKLDKLTADAARLETLFQDLPEERARPETDAFAKRRGELPWPLPGKLLAKFGTPRQVGDLKWRGALIGSPEGTPVRAIAAGRVVFADRFRNWGYLVILDHGAGYMSLYGFTDAGAREVGEWVEADGIIATSGQIPGRQATGLYFEVRHNGKPQDPARWCLATPEQRQASRS